MLCPGAEFAVSPRGSRVSYSVRKVQKVLMNLPCLQVLSSIPRGTIFSSTLTHFNRDDNEGRVKV